MAEATVRSSELEVALRRDARSILDAAIAAVDPEALVRGALADGPPAPAPGGEVLLVAVGKAALAMARGAVDRLAVTPWQGIAVAPAGGGGRAPDGFAVHRAGHPLPDQEGLEGARAVQELVRRAGPDDRILLLLSGGGSALLTLPARDVSLDDVRWVTHRLQRAGADIRELNTVRKHLEVLKGGGLARIAVPAPLRVLVLSDVVGDHLDVIASGPASPDPSTFADAIEVLARRGLWDEVPAAVRAHLLYGREGDERETPKEGDPCFGGVEVRVVGNVSTALDAAAERAAALGYPPEIRAADVEGPARDVGARLAREALECDGPCCLLYGGETTVSVVGEGKGGRNQEVALAAALGIDRPGVIVLSAGTDGVDGPTDAAGAMATGLTTSRGEALGLDARAHLEGNDAYPFFEALGDLVVTGPTGTNVMDVMMVLVGPGVGVLD